MEGHSLVAQAELEGEPGRQQQGQGDCRYRGLRPTVVVGLQPLGLEGEEGEGVLRLRGLQAQALPTSMRSDLAQAVLVLERLESRSCRSYSSG